VATQLFLIPQAFDSLGNLAPKYVSTDLLNKSWVAMPFGIEGLVLLATDPNAALAAESDVFAFPANLDAILSGPDVSNVQAFFQANNIPSAYVLAGTSWRSVVRTTAKCFQIAQRHVGVNQAGIFTTNTPTSLAAQSAAKKANGIVPAAPIRVGIAPTLSGSLSTLTAVKSNLAAVASSFGFSAPDSNGTLETALTFLGNQFLAPLVLDRGDGFSI
jgi:hypothetical protein